MLILTRKPGESLYIGDDIKIIIVEIKGNQIRVGIDAPPEKRIYREEIYLQILDENRKAAEAAHSTDSDMERLSAAWQKRVPQGIAGKLSSGIAPKLAARPGDVPAPQVVVKRKKREEEK